jgi:hypothetical protein
VKFAERQPTFRTNVASYFRNEEINCLLLIYSLAYASALKICFSETSVDFQRITRRYIPEYRTLDSYAVQLKNGKESNLLGKLRIEKVIILKFVLKSSV